MGLSTAAYLSRLIPVHRDQDLKVGTLKALMKIAQLSEEDLY